MRIYKTGETFSANHAPLVSTALFETVQGQLAGNRVDRHDRHVFRFSRIVHCGTCGYSLIGERQKGHVYYRCHDRPFKNPAVCPRTSVREEDLDQAILGCLADVDLSDQEMALARATLATKRTELEQVRAAAIQTLRLQLDQIESRLAKLTDLLVDGTLDKSLFTEKQNVLLMERTKLHEKLAEAQQGLDRSLESLARTVELARSPSMLYKTSSPEKKRELAKTLLSNLVASAKNVDVTLALPFRLIAERQNLADGRPYRGDCRTWEHIFAKILNQHT
jgi:hypothetical protein